jgi:group I intron endonuclease
MSHSSNIGVYAIKNTLNSKVYIGSSINLKRRFYVHRYTLSSNKHHNEHLQRAWNYYGVSCFVFIILESCNKEQLREIEQKYINEYKAYDRQFGYNLDSLVGPFASRPIDWAEKCRNTRRKNQIYCKHGHEYTNENTLWRNNKKHRVCKICYKKSKHKEFQQMPILTIKERQEMKELLINNLSTCPKGHLYSSRTLRIDNKGRRICSECRKLYYANKKMAV